VPLEKGVLLFRAAIRVNLTLSFFTSLFNKI